MSKGIFRFSQKDKKRFYWFLKEMQELIGKYGMSGELTLYDEEGKYDHMDYDNTTSGDE